MRNQQVTRVRWVAAMGLDSLGETGVWLRGAGVHRVPAGFSEAVFAACRRAEAKGLASDFTLHLFGAAVSGQGVRDGEEEGATAISVRG